MSQAEKAQELMEEVKQKTAAVTTQASAVTSAAKDIAHATGRQMEALTIAKNMSSSVTAATQDALAAFRCYFRVMCAAKSCFCMKSWPP